MRRDRPLEPVPAPAHTVGATSSDRSHKDLVTARRLERQRRQRARLNRQRAVAAVALALAAVLVGWRWSTRAPDSAATAEHAVGHVRLSRASAPREDAAQMRPAVSRPTPIIATRGDLIVRLPVRLEDLTELGFHQAAYPYALSMRSALPTADMAQAKRDRSTHRDITRQQPGPDAVLTGHALVMWRDRPGKPDTAVDVGAAPGSIVLAPVSGTVVKVKRYLLYGTHEDFEIHIRPDGFPRIDCVMIHITDVAIRPGDRVIGGVSRIGAVRKLSHRERLQLGQYTKNGGDHTHVQLNDVTHPDYRGLDGALVTGPS